MQGRRPEEATCEACGVTFHPYPDSAGRFCSRQCWGRSRRKPGSAAQRFRASHADADRLDDEVACVQCGTMFRPFTGSRARYCSISCVGKANRKSDGERVTRKFLHRPEHPLATVNGKVLAYRLALYERIGPGAHPCHWCGKPVTWTARKGAGAGREELAVDHLDGDRYNDDPANLVPACNDCNTLRGFMSGWLHRHPGLPLERLLPHG